MASPAAGGWFLRPALALALARGTLFPWVPVLMALGIGAWFQLPAEPAAPAYGLVAALALAALALWWRGPELAQPLAVAALCLALGFLAAGLRGQVVAAPMLEAPYRGPVTGRLVEIDRSQSDALRLTLDRVVLADMAPADTPRRVRLSLLGADPGFALTAGQVVMVEAWLDAPSGAVEPGGFDFRRLAWFQGLGAVGYSRTPLMLWAEPQGAEQAIARLRLYLSRAIQARVPGDAGAFAAGAMTGDRSEIRQATVEDLRAASLAHLLAISGMNLAFLTGFVFALVRGGLALWPAVALRWNSKKIAAVVAGLVSSFYLALSGANVATERAYVMMVIFLGAVLLDRRALSLRNVALAAALLLAWQPESLLQAGFQLSFSATVALIAGFEMLREKNLAAHLPPWARPVLVVVLSSVLAGFATAPYAAAIFNRYSDYGLIANLLTVPVMSVLMGAGAIAALLAPLGLAAPALWVMGWAAEWILYVAHAVAGLQGAVAAVKAPMPWVVPLLSLGAAWVILWRGQIRLAGLLAMVLAGLLWAISPRPVGLVSPDGRLVGLIGPQGRALSAATSGSFAARSWLASDGDLADAKAAAARPGFQGPKGVKSFNLGGVSGAALSGKAGQAALAQVCASTRLVILAEGLEAPAADGPCHLVDAAHLAQSGALELRPTSQGLWLIPARQSRRAWDRPLPLVTPILLEPGPEDQ